MSIASLVVYDYINVRSSLFTMSTASLAVVIVFVVPCCSMCGISSTVASACTSQLVCVEAKEVEPPKFPVPPKFPAYPSQLVVTSLLPSSGFSYTGCGWGANDCESHTLTNLPPPLLPLLLWWYPPLYPCPLLAYHHLVHSVRHCRLPSLLSLQQPLLL